MRGRRRPYKPIEAECNGVQREFWAIWTISDRGIERWRSPGDMIGSHEDAEYDNYDGAETLYFDEDGVEILMSYSIGDKVIFWKPPDLTRFLVDVVTDRCLVDLISEDDIAAYSWLKGERERLRLTTRKSDQA